MSLAPPKPSEVSPNGQEVWDWADRFSAHVHRQDEMRKLRDQIFELQVRCGSCYFWMKSRDCPRERNVDGMSRGPSVGSMKCDKFQMDPRSSLLLTQRREQLAALEAEDAPKSV